MDFQIEKKISILCIQKREETPIAEFDHNRTSKEFEEKLKDFLNPCTEEEKSWRIIQNHCFKELFSIFSNIIDGVNKEHGKDNVNDPNKTFKNTSVSPTEYPEINQYKN